MGYYESSLKCSVCGCNLIFQSFDMRYACWNADCPSKKVAPKPAPATEPER